MNQILYTSSEIRRHVVDLFANSRGRRIAIVAFVGEGAEGFLPRPNGLELVCWPKEGGTNPSQLRRLIRRGTKIQFAKSLHMKVCWTSDLGCVISSANLSTNALGSGGLKEAGVLLPRGAVNIDRILRSISAHPITPSSLASLERRHKAYVGRNPAARPKQKSTFREWLLTKPTLRAQWKLGVFSEYQTATSKATKRNSIEEYGRAPVDFLTAQRDAYRQWDWVLKFRITETGKMGSPKWLCVSNVFKVQRSDKMYDREFPMEAVQNRPLNEYPPPPFELDGRFRLALKKALRHYGVDRLLTLKTNVPPRLLLNRLRRAYENKPRVGD